MSGRVEFLDQLAEEKAGQGVVEQHSWALDVVDNGDNTNYVALARARSRAIASRVHDLHHVFTAYRRLLVDEAAAQADAELGDGPALGDDDDEAQLFSALAQSVMQMSEDVQRAGRRGTTARSNRRAKLGTTQEVRETEEQFDSLVDLLSKQATKLTDDLDAIVLLAQARIDRADADAQDLIGQMRDTSRVELAALRAEAAHQVQMLLDLHAVRARHTKTLRRSFSGWHGRARCLAQRKRTLAQAVQRLSTLAAVHAWGGWIEFIHEQRLESAYALHAAAVEAGSTQLRLQHERTVEQSYWRAQAKSDTRLLQANMSTWIAYTADSVSLNLAIKRMRERVRSMKAAQALGRWVSVVQDARADRRQVEHRAELSDAENTLSLQRIASARHAVQRRFVSIVALAFDAWHWVVQNTKRLELTRLRTVSRLGGIIQLRAWQQWVAVVAEARVALLCAEHDTVVAEAEAQLRAQRDLVVYQAKRRSLAREVAQRLTKTFDGWLEFATEQRRAKSLLNRASDRARMTKLCEALDAWRLQATIARDASRTAQRVVRRIDSMRASRAWATWLAVVRDAKAQTIQAEHRAAMAVLKMNLNRQCNTCITHMLLRQKRKTMGGCFAAWRDHLQLQKQLQQFTTKLVLRIVGMKLAACFDAWNCLVGNARHIELTRLRAISRIAGIYQERAWQQWLAVVEQSRTARERMEHTYVVQSVGAAMMRQWDAYVRVARTRACRRVLRSSFCEWADLMKNSASLNCIKFRVIGRRRLFRLSTVISVWHKYVEFQEREELTRSRVAKRLGDILLARCLRLWLCMVCDQRLKAEQDAHTATVTAARATAQQRRERLIARSTLRMGAHRRVVLLNDALQRWIDWRNLLTAQRVCTTRVIARTRAIYLRMIMRMWCLATEEGAKNRERLEYTAIIDDAEDILATQWETTVRHYLGRMDRLRQQRCLKYWVDWATQRASRKNTMWRVCSRLDAMRCAASFVVWQAYAFRSVWSKAVCNRAVHRLNCCLLSEIFGLWASCVRTHKRVTQALAMVKRSFAATALSAWKEAAKALHNGRKVQFYRMAVESAENLCLAQFHRSIRLLTERCAKRCALRWLSATWVHWVRHTEISRQEKMQAKAEFDLQEMQRQAEMLVELRMELAESHREQAQLCHEAELSARREKAAAEASFSVEQERSDQAQTVFLVRDEVLGLRQELSQRERDLAEAGKREAALVEHRELAARSRQEADRRTEAELSELLELQRQAQMERSSQEQSLAAAQAELSRLQSRELAEAEARKTAERDKDVAQRAASVERNEHAEARRQAQLALDEVSRLRKHQADMLSQQERRAVAAAALERNKQAAAIKTMHDEVSKMQQLFLAAATPPAAPRAPQQPNQTHDASSIADALRATAAAAGQHTKTTQEELERRADSVANLRAELAEAHADASRRAAADADARREAQAKAKAMIEESNDARSLQLAAQEIVARVESVALGAPAAEATAAGGHSRARRGSWLLVQSPASSDSSPLLQSRPVAATPMEISQPPQAHVLQPEQHGAPATQWSPEDTSMALATPQRLGGHNLQIHFGHNLPTPQQASTQHSPRTNGAVPNTVQRGAGSWRAYEKEADELNAQAQIDARHRLAAERQAEEMAAKLAQMQAMLADNASDRSSQGGID